ncbi:MAG: hypothetical protein P1U61_08225 [Legionellaceae bacterium]|nr:hypothetical protein [Legionellaceae bacterium]
MLHQLKHWNKKTSFLRAMQMLLILPMSVYANDKYYLDESKTHLPNALNELFISPSKQLLSDTAGPSITLFIGTASDRNIRLLSNITYYSTPTCFLGSIASTADVTGMLFTFQDGVPFFFGTEALSALSAGNVATQCIDIIMQQSSTPFSGAYAHIEVQNLSCNGVTCSGGNVCENAAADWSTAALPPC